MRLLFLTSTRIGDAVLSTGALDALLARHPGARVTVVAGVPAAPLFRAVPGLARLIPLRKRRWNRHWAWLWRQVAGQRWDVVVDLRASPLAYLLRAGRRYVVGRRPGDQTHRVTELGALLDLDPPPAPRLWLDPADRAHAATVLPEGAGPVLAVAPAATWAGKQWPAARFAEAAAHLTATDGPLPGAQVAVLASAGDRAQSAPLLDSLPTAQRLDLVGALDLPAAAAVLARCRMFLGNDSGLMHLAAAAGTPTLGLFGPTPDGRYRPWGAHADIVRTPESLGELRRRAATGTPPARLMDSLDVTSVLAAAEILLARTTPRSAG